MVAIRSTTTGNLKPTKVLKETRRGKTAQQNSSMLLHISSPPPHNYAQSCCSTTRMDGRTDGRSRKNCPICCHLSVVIPAGGRGGPQRTQLGKAPGGSQPLDTHTQTHIFIRSREETQARILATQAVQRENWRHNWNLKTHIAAGEAPSV